MTLPATRRTVLLATGGAAAAAALTAGCGDNGDSGSSSSSERSSAGGRELAKTTDIPVGGGTVFADEKVVVTQPTKDDFKAFSAICTHMGCTVNTVADGTIDCPCHGSKYHIADGSVAGGPAPKPLPAKQITVTGGTIKLA
ncbi:Rieske (2Fe-2S) protein [Streptomyces sp. NPDC051677]|uniref:Rieske (2Fe-2S) protein n=1 Tax=Streptomyces sp. NPDC051677 TaxID=3365669 RepID=UPI0037CD6AF6